MRYRELLILLPCHSLEDFPVHHAGDDAQGLIAGYTALWHPSLLAVVDDMPRWKRSDDPPEDVAEKLIIVPSLSAGELPTGFAQRCREAGSTFLRREHDRETIVSKALEALTPGEGHRPPSELDADLVDDFFALGFGYLQVQLLTRQLRYSSNLDEHYFKQKLIDAAKATVTDDTAAARAALTACFDVLSEERNHFYPVDASLVDLVLVAETTLGDSLTSEIDQATAERGTPINLMMAASLVERVAAETPELIDRLREAVTDGRVTLVGGEEIEGPLSLGGEGLLHRELRRGREVYLRYLGAAPTVFARRRYGLSPMWPQVLVGEGFVGALHFTLEEGKTPTGHQSKTRWEGRGGVEIPALGKAPVRADEAGTFLGFGVKLGEAMDSDHVATMTLARWAGQKSPALDDLRRMTRYSGALGRFVSLQTYFEDTDLPTHFDPFTFDQYRSPYLKQAIVRQQDDPVSSVRRYWHRVVRAMGWNVVRTLATCLGQARPQDQADAMTPSMLLARADAELYEAYPVQRRSRSATPAAVAALGEEPASDTLGIETDNGHATEADETQSNELPIVESNPLTEEPSADGLLADLTRLAGAIVEGAKPVPPGTPGAALFAFNPWSQAIRQGFGDSGLPTVPASERPVYAAERIDGRVTVVADLPAGGYVHVAAPGGDQTSRTGGQTLAEDGILRNEYFEVLINPETGALQSIHDYDKRGNRLSAQLAFRQPSGAGGRDDDASDGVYTRMEADSVTVTQATVTVGEIESRGRLIDRRGASVGTFSQRFRVYRGSRVVAWEITLDPTETPRPDGWESYYCARLAWSDETSEILRGAPLVRTPTEHKRIESPLFLEIADAQRRTAILTGGLAFHRRQGMRMLDTILIPRGEQARTFRLGLGVDLPAVLPEALAACATPPSMLVSGRLNTVPSAWLIHLDQRSVVMTHCEPTFGPDPAVAAAARPESPADQVSSAPDSLPAGVMMHLLETAGRATTTNVSWFRPFAKAWRCDLRGERIEELDLAEGAIVVPLRAHQLLAMEAVFA